MTDPHSATRSDDTGRSEPIDSDRPSDRADTERRATNGHSVWVVVFISLFGLVGLTGLLLMTTYSPSVDSAWGSVWYIQTQLYGGWFIRGLHRFGSDALIILASLYLTHLLMQRLYSGAHRGRWLAGLAFLFGGMAIALTGNLLPWDQHGYWGMTVRLNILARTPLVGDFLRSFVVGGTEMGALTLTRFYTLHVLILPGILAGVAVWWFRRERVACDALYRNVKPDNSRDIGKVAPTRSSLLPGTGAWLLVFIAIATAAWYAQGQADAALLSAPADPIAADYPARPEWFNLFLFQWLKAFHGPIAETVGSVVLPGIIVHLLIAVPWVDRGERRGLVRRGTLLSCGVLAIGVVWLTVAALLEDAPPSETVLVQARAQQANAADLSPEQEQALRAAVFNAKQVNAAKRARRTIELANVHGIPPEGPLGLLANDPVTRGPELFAAHCATCHRFDGHDGLGHIPADPATSSDLAGFASQAWIAEFLADPMSTKRFGLMKKPDGEPAHTRMADWLDETRSDLPNDEARAAFEADLDAVAAYLESESNDPGRFAETAEATQNPIGDTEANAVVRQGRAFFVSTCNECHSYKGEREGTLRAPEMFGYGSVEWIDKFISDPSDNALYRSRGREPAQMPSFAHKLTGQERQLIAQWLHAKRPLQRSAP